MNSLDHFFYAELLEAAKELLRDVAARYPGEELRCPHMRRLEAAVEAIAFEDA